jgi:hypothetical protein
MKRAWLIAAAVWCGFAQSGRDSYRDAYRAWREADPNLERDAGRAGAPVAARAVQAAALAAKFGAERSEYLKRAAGAQEQSLAVLESSPPELADISKGLRENVAAETAVVRHNLDTFANDPDPGIQRLKSMLQRESVALTSLATAIGESQKAAAAVKAANAAADEARTKALGELQALVGVLKSAAVQADQESAAWAEYYRKLAEGPRAPAVSTPAPTTAASPPRSGAVTPLPLVRYTGAWVFPAGGLYHGPQPEFIDLVVHEESGRADGTLFARFKLPPGSKDDPVLRFDFSGEFKNSRSQVFKLQTSDGAKGNIELIPGPAFNLLEVNFWTEPKPGKITQGNAVLIKK